MVGDNALDPAARQASEGSDASFGRKPRASYTIYLACWMAALAAACSLALRISLSISPDAELILRVALKAPPILAMLATACYLWILFHTTRNLNTHIINSARRRDLIVLMEDIEKLKKDIAAIREHLSLKEK